MEYVIQKYPIRYDKKTNSFTTEAGDLGFGIMDKIPKEITLKNEMTGKSVVFHFSKYEFVGKDEDRELAGWVYKSDDNIIFTILND